MEDALSKNNSVVSSLNLVARKKPRAASRKLNGKLISL